MQKLSERPQNRNFGQHALEASLKARKRDKAARVASYNASPKLCAQCGCPIAYCKSLHQKKYCSQRCAAIANNATRSAHSRAKQRSSVCKTLGVDPGRRTDYERYRESCKFRLRRSDIPRLNGDHFLYAGMYSPRLRQSGATKDHMFSVLDGFRNDVLPIHIRHPANCRIILNSANSSKGSVSCVTIEELYDRICEWDDIKSSF